MHSLSNNNVTQRVTAVWQSALWKAAGHWIQPRSLHAIVSHYKKKYGTEILFLRLSLPYVIV